MKFKEACIGVATGLANGLFGAGGGTIAVPALQKFLKVEVHKSHATAIAIILPLSVVSVFIYTRGAVNDWGTVLYVSAGGVAGGFVGAKILNRLSKNNLHKLFGAFMIAAALRMIFGGDGGFLDMQQNFATVWCVAVGFVSGILSGLGIGGGTVLIPALVILFGIPQQAAQGINLIYFIPTAAIALTVHAKNGNIQTKGLWVIIFFGVLSAVAGALVATKINSDILRKIFGVFLLGMGVVEIRK